MLCTVGMLIYWYRPSEFTQETSYIFFLHRGRGLGAAVDLNVFLGSQLVKMLNWKLFMLLCV